MMCRELSVVERVFDSCRWACQTDAFEQAINLYSCSCETGCKLNPTGVGAVLFLTLLTIYLTVWVAGKIKRKMK